MKHEITAKRLREALENAGMRPAELSERSGVSQSSISQYMNGSHAPSNISSGKMAKVLGCNPVWLMGFDVPSAEPITPSQDPPHEYVSSSGEKYYFSDEAAAVAQEVYEDSSLRMLFDAARDAKPEDLKMAADMLKRFKGTNPDG